MEGSNERVPDPAAFIVSFYAAYLRFDAAYLRFAAAGIRPAADCAHQAAGSACSGGPEAMGVRPQAVLLVLGCIGADLSAFEQVRAGSE